MDDRLAEAIFSTILRWGSILLVIVLAVTCTALSEQPVDEEEAARRRNEYAEWEQEQLQKKQEEEDFVRRMKAYYEGLEYQPVQQDLNVNKKTYVPQNKVRSVNDLETEQLISLAMKTQALTYGNSSSINSSSSKEAIRVNGYDSRSNRYDLANSKSIVSSQGNTKASPRVNVNLNNGVSQSNNLDVNKATVRTPSSSTDISIDKIIGSSISGIIGLTIACYGIVTLDKKKTPSNEKSGYGKYNIIYVIIGFALIVASIAIIFA